MVVPAIRPRFAPRADVLAARFSREIVAARAVAGLSQAQVAQRAGISQALVSQVERGRTLPSLSVMGRLALATGHDLSLRLFPADGVRLRDSGQLHLAEQIRGVAHPSWQLRLEVPVAALPDRRAADVVLSGPIESIEIEIERSLLDLQAQLRSAQLKRAALVERVRREVRLVLAMPDTRRNRAAVDQHRPLLEAALPLASRSVWASLRSGEPLGADGLLWVRVRARPPRAPRPSTSLR
jgi:transcriptional regulator with XRE-family HTH domain